MNLKRRIDLLERACGSTWCRCVGSDDDVIAGLVAGRNPSVICPRCRGRVLFVPYDDQVVIDGGADEPETAN